MVQVLQRSEDPSVRIGKMLGGAIESAGDVASKYKEKHQQSKEKQSLEKEYGMKFSSNPEIMKIQLQAAEKSKQKNKEYEFVSKLMGEDEQTSNFSQNNTSPDYDSPANQNLYPQNDTENPSHDRRVSQSPSGKKKLPSQKTVLSASMTSPAAGRVLGDMRKEGIEEERFRTKEEKDLQRHQEDMFIKNRDFHTKQLSKTMEKADETIESAPIVKNNLKQLKNAIKSKNVSGIGNFLVTKYGWDPAINKDVALFANSAKNLFVSSLNDIPGARPNQFLEKYLAQALPAIGRSEESNEAVYNVQEFNEDLKLADAEIKRRLYNEDVQKQGYSDSQTLNYRAQEELKTYAEDRQNRFAYETQENIEKNLSDAELIDKIFRKDFIEEAPLTPRTANLIYKIVGENDEKYLKKIQELGLTLNKYAGVEQ